MSPGVISGNNPPSEVTTVHDMECKFGETESGLVGEASSPMNNSPVKVNM